MLKLLTFYKAETILYESCYTPGTPLTEFHPVGIVINNMQWLK